MVFVTKGSVGVGYRLFNEIFFGKQIIMSLYKKIISVINDYSCLHSKCSEFLYKPIDFVEAMSMRKENFNQVMQHQIGQKMRSEIARKYKYIIQEPMHEHRNEMARRFQNRIDYVNIKAYGIGKVDVEKRRKGASQILSQEVGDIEQRSESMTWEEESFDQ